MTASFVLILLLLMSKKMIIRLLHCEFMVNLWTLQDRAFIRTLGFVPRSFNGTSKYTINDFLKMKRFSSFALTP